MLIGINGGYFPAMCRVCLSKLQKELLVYYNYIKSITQNNVLVYGFWSFSTLLLIRQMQKENPKTYPLQN